MALAATAMTAKKDKQTLYIQRVKRFFAQVKRWLPDELSCYEIPRQLSDESGDYDAFALAIIKQSQPDSAVADLFPQGYSVLLGEGLIELAGPFGEESIVYLLPDELTIKRNGKTQPMFKGLQTDGWYWMEDPRRGRVLPLSQELFIELLGLTGAYESAE